MSVDQRHPFESIESAQEFIALLAETIEEAQREIAAEQERLDSGDQRRREAWLLALHKVKTLGFHVQKSHRALNDLRTLRRLLDGELAVGVPAVPLPPGKAARNGHGG